MSTFFTHIWAGPIVHCFYIYWSLSPWCLCQIYVQCSCLHFFQAIELEIELQIYFCTEDFMSSHFYNSCTHHKECLYWWLLYQCTLLDLKALVIVINSKVRRSFNFSGDNKRGLSIELPTQLLFSYIYQSKWGFPICVKTNSCTSWGQKQW